MISLDTNIQIKALEFRGFVNYRFTHAYCYHHQHHRRGTPLG
jgi:hypothetical protein